jgi:hypothetical protein
MATKKHLSSPSPSSNGGVVMIPLSLDEATNRLPPLKPIFYDSIKEKEVVPSE